MSNLYCSICCNDNINKTLNCINCNYITCISCIKKTKIFICYNCNTIYNDKLIKPFIKDQRLFKIYMKCYVENKINNYSKITIRKCILSTENKNLIRFGFQKVESDFEYIFKCNNKDCKGMVNLNYYCNDCKHIYCKECEEIMNESHICDENVLKNINNLKKNCKKCINCYTYFEKGEGCNDMRCLNCGVYFNWRNLKIDYRGNSNKTEDSEIINKEHQYNYLNLNVFNSIRRNIRSPDGILYQEVLKKYIKLIKVLELVEGEYFIAKNKNELNEKNIEKLYFLYKKQLYYQLILNFYLENSFIDDNKRYVSLTIEEIISFLNNIHENYILPGKFLYMFSYNKFITNNENSSSKEVNSKIYNILNEEYKNVIKRDIVLPPGIKNDNTILKKLLTYRMHVKICLDYKNKIYDSLYIIKNLNIENVVLIIANNNIEKFWKLHFQKFNLNNKVKIIYITNKNMFTGKDKETFIKMTLDYIRDKAYLLIIDELHLYKNNTYNIFSRIICMTIENRFDTNRYLLSFSSLHPKNSMFYNLILEKENNYLKKLKTFNILFEMLSYLTKSEILELTKKIYYGKKYHKNCIFPYLTKDMVFKKTEDDQVLCLYNNNNWSQINIFNYTRPKIVNRRIKFENFTHNLCKKEKTVCKFCSICTPDYVNNDLMTCCYIHIKPNLNLKLSHEICYDESLPITGNLSVLTHKTMDKNKYIDNMSKILLNYGFSLYEINFLFNTILIKNLEFINEYNSFIIHKIFSTEDNNIPLQIFTKKYLLSNTEIECMNSSFTNFDYINKTQITSCDVVVTKGYMQMETMYINHIFKDITEICNKYYNVKIIVCLYFNSSISDLQKLLEEKKYNYLILNNSTSNKDLIIKKFKTSNYILLLNIKSFNTITEDIDDRKGNEPRYILLPFIYDIINTSIFLKKTYTEYSESYPVVHVLNNFMNKNLDKIKKYNFNFIEWKSNDLWNCFI